MKIFIENLKPNMSPFNGKGKFVRRLATSLEDNGCKIVESPIDCDINFRMNSLPSTTHGKRVVRLDDAVYSKEVMHKKTEANKVLRRAVKEADGIVYQSQIAKNMCDGILGFCKGSFKIIYNGVSIDFSEEIDCVDLPGKNFLHASERLFPMRRLDRILDCWQEFVMDKDDAFLHIVYDKRHNYTSIKDFGSFKNVMVYDIMIQPKLNNLIASCDAAILMKYQDSCPNFGAESIACGTPLLIGNSVGLSEVLSEPEAIVVRVDDTFTFSFVDWTKPPFEHPERLISSFGRVYDMEKPTIKLPEVLNINFVAKQYIDLFEEIL